MRFARIRKSCCVHVLPAVFLVLVWATHAHAAYGVDLFPDGCRCGLGVLGDRNIAGSSFISDKLIYASDLDVLKRRFETWCIDQSRFGVRFVRYNASDSVISERWVGVCA